MIPHLLLDIAQIRLTHLFDWLPETVFGTHPPQWMTWLAIIYIASSLLSTLVISFDILAGHRHDMWIMDLVWPITALYASVATVYAYLKIGRADPAEDSLAEDADILADGGEADGKAFWQTVGIGDTHCGSGCTIGDIIAETFVFFVPIYLIVDGHFGEYLGTIALDYTLAFLFGIAFQFFSIRPMKGLSVREGIIEALKADTLSLTAFQIGLFGWMWIFDFVLFTPKLPKTSFTFWFMMQIGMILGFLTSYPMNWFLIKWSIKEGM